MGDIQRRIADIKEKIHEKLMHPYLFQNIKKPVIDEDKLLLLVSVMDDLKIPLEELENYTLTTMLLQVALDTHEQVTNSVLDEDNLKNRQLTVLAGVYYSGLYYKILAEYEDIKVIRMLAEGIKTINDQKIIVYQKDLDGLDKLMGSVKAIESSLIEQFTQYFKNDVWDEIVTNFLLIKRLIAEKEQFIQSKTSIVFEALKQVTFPRDKTTLKELSLEQQNYLVLVCDRYIEFSKRVLEQGRKNMPKINDLLDYRITAILDQQKPMAKTFAEEGY